MIKNKPRRFKPTHLKLRLIMKVEWVMRASVVCVCVFVGGGGDV